LTSEENRLNESYVWRIVDALHIVDKSCLHRTKSSHNEVTYGIKAKSREENKHDQ
jgi:hypothetical protein